MNKMSSNSAHDSKCDCADELHNQDKDKHKHVNGECVHQNGSKHSVHQKKK